MKLPQSTPLLMGLSMIFGGILFSVIHVIAQSDPDVQGIPQVIPYQGILELDGRPVNRLGDRAMWIEFQLYNAENSTNPLYRQRIQVEVYQGRFTALIGPSSEDGAYLTQVIRSHPSLYLGMVLLGDDLESASDDIEMSNRQRLMSTPYAMWSSGASQFQVLNNLNVGGTVEASRVAVNGQVSATGDLQADGNVTVGQDLTVNGSALIRGGLSINGTDLALGVNNDRGAGNRVYQRALVHNTADRLFVNFEGDFEGGTVMDSNVNVTGTLNANGLQVNGQDIQTVIRNWVRAHCHVSFGWRDGCGGCTSTPEYH